MTKEQEDHLRDIKYNLLNDIDAKYRHGQREHGGDVWKKQGMIDNAIEEVLDLAVYLYTLRDQISKVKDKFNEAYPELDNDKK